MLKQKGNHPVGRAPVLRVRRSKPFREILFLIIDLDYEDQGQTAPCNKTLPVEITD